MITNYLIGGAINALLLVVVAFLLSKFVGDIYGRALLAIFLIIAGGAYFGFATAALTSGLWVIAELLHALVIGAMGLHGLRGSGLALPAVGAATFSLSFTAVGNARYASSDE